MNDTGYVIQNYVAGICCSHTTMAFEGMTYWHYQKFQDRYICSESEFCKANQHCKKMSQGKENRECVEL
ncbi:MAG TPA: hypothetical protein VFX64_03800, partial [Candidatus Nitrosotalea sp.]|nr:hypothetical protein [Candidatus Nitrosotalea sp.]